MEPDISALEKLCLAYELVGDVLSLAPELYDARLDKALFLIYQATKRARRISRARFCGSVHFGKRANARSSNRWGSCPTAKSEPT